MSPVRHAASAPAGVRVRSAEPLERWVRSVLIAAGEADTWRHVLGVRDFALATFAGWPEVDDAALARVEQAALVHDVSVVLGRDRFAEVARAGGIAIGDVEARVPMLLHQELSALIAEEGGAIDDPVVLAAVRRHTTLCAAPSRELELLWIADKVAWDQPGRPPYDAAARAALARRDVASAIRAVLRHWAATIPRDRRHPAFVDALGWYGVDDAGASTYVPSTDVT